MECLRWRECPQQKSSCLIKAAQSYGGAKIAFSFFLSIYSRAAAEEVVDMRGGWADPDLFLWFGKVRPKKKKKKKVATN